MNAQDVADDLGG